MHIGVCAKFKFTNMSCISPKVLSVCDLRPLPNPLPSSQKTRLVCSAWPFPLGRGAPDLWVPERHSPGLIPQVTMASGISIYTQS